MEGCFMFQWGGICFSDRGGLHFYMGGGVPHGGASVLVGGGGGCRGGGGVGGGGGGGGVEVPPLWETLPSGVKENFMFPFNR